MQDKAGDKARLRRECLLFLFVLIASYVCATHSPGNGTIQSGYPEQLKGR